MDIYREFEEVESFLRRFLPGWGLQGWNGFRLIPTDTQLTDNGLSIHELWILASDHTKKRVSGQTPVDYICQADTDAGMHLVRIRLYALEILGDVGEPLYQVHLSTRPGGHGMKISLWYRERTDTAVQQFVTAMA